MLQLPRLSQEGLGVLSLCVHVDLKPEFPEVGPDEFITALLPGNEGIRVRKIVDSDKETCHFHIEAGFDTFMPPFGDESQVEQVLAIPALLAGPRQPVSTWGRFRIAHESLADNSVIQALSGVSIPSPSKGYELTISGCTLDVSGDGPIRELRWWPAGESEVGVEVSARMEIVISDDMLLDAAAVLENGLDQFVRLKTAAARGTL